MFHKCQVFVKHVSQLPTCFTSVFLRILLIIPTATDWRNLWSGDIELLWCIDDVHTATEEHIKCKTYEKTQHKVNEYSREKSSTKNPSKVQRARRLTAQRSQQKYMQLECTWVPGTIYKTLEVIWTTRLVQHVSHAVNQHYSCRYTRLIGGR